MTYKSAAKTLEELRTGKVTSQELVESAIQRIEKYDNDINAVVVRDFENARQAAKAADAARGSGQSAPLLGLPITVKEAFNVEGLPTTWGVPNTRDIPITQDAVAIKRLKEAGAIILGKTNVCLFLADWQSSNEVYGTTNNPWDKSRTPGGSSGGSAAALAAGFTSLELGSDIGGSLRIPAHFCGVYSHKPTHGIVPDRGHVPPGVPLMEVSPVLDLAVCGPMARTAEDLALELDVLAGPDTLNSVAYRLELPPRRHDKLSDYRVLVLTEHPLLKTTVEVQDEIHAFADRLEKAGCRVDRSGSHNPDLELIGRIYMQMLMSIFSADLRPDVFENAIARAAEFEASDTSLEATLARGTVLSHRDWIINDRIRTEIKHQWMQTFKDWDVVICPVTPTVAFEHNHEKNFAKRRIEIDGNSTPYLHQSLWVSIPTLTGHPSTAIPISRTKNGMPVGAQVIGPFLEDYTTIGFASLVEQEFGGFTPPPGFE